MTRKGLERCTHCGTIHYLNCYPAVYIGGKYFCKPSCHNSYNEGVRHNATNAGRAADCSTHARHEHG